jgi:hypothetical protein
MVAYPNTGSQFLSDDGRNQTRTAVSTNIIIEVDGITIGGIQSIDVNEVRDIRSIDEVGTDGHIDSVPSKSTNIDGSCSRVRFDNLRIATSFARGFIHVSSQRTPFDIIIKDTFAAPPGDEGEADPQRTLVTTIKNVWIKSIKTTYKADDFIITDSMDWTAEHIFTTLGSNAPAVTPNGGRNIQIIDNNAFEQAADVGQRRGALDASGLLLAVDETI